MDDLPQDPHMERSQDPHVERIHVLTRAVKQAKSDSQKFAALLAVSKMLKAEELTKSQRKEVFEAIGFSFPIRLLTSSGDSECPKSLLNDLGLSILTSFVSDPDLVEAPEHKRIIPEVLKIVESNQNQPNENLYDCFCYLACIAAVDYNCLIILKHNGIKCLINAYCCNISEPIRPLFWSTLYKLIRFDTETIWLNHKESMLDLFNYVTECADSDFSAKKFEIYEELSALLMNLPSDYVEFYRKKKWIKDLKKSLFQVLASRVSSGQRNPTLRLCHHLTEAFGLNWTHCNEDVDEREKKFPVLMAKLACVEIQLVIHSWISTKERLAQVFDSEEMSVFVACCAIFEAACSAIADYDTNEYDNKIFTYKDIEDIQGSLAETIEGLGLSLLPDIMDLPELKHLVLGCVRTIGSWLNIQVFATSKIGVSLVETVFSAFKFCLEFEPSDSIKSLTPALLHFAESENTKNQLISLNILSCLTSSLIEKTLSNESSCLCAQCLMTFVVESPNLAEFDNILPSLMDYSLKLEHNQVLCFYVNLLALMLWNKRFDPSLLYPQSERFFRNIIRLLHSIHAINGSAVKVTKR